jgi:hypothetical protein
MRYEVQERSRRRLVVLIAFSVGVDLYVYRILALRLARCLGSDQVQIASIWRTMLWR